MVQIKPEASPTLTQRKFWVSITYSITIDWAAVAFMAMQTKNYVSRQSALPQAYFNHTWLHKWKFQLLITTKIWSANKLQLLFWKRLKHWPVDHAEQTLHQVRQVRHLGALIGEDGPVHGGELGQALQGVLSHVRVLPNLPVYLQGERGHASPFLLKLYKEETYVLSKGVGTLDGLTTL